MERDMRLLKAAGNIWAIVGITLLLLLTLEGFLTLAFRIKAGLSESSAAYVDPRGGADAYSDRSWAPRYYLEFEHSQVPQWKPYVYWRQPAFQGKYINVTENGLRFTPRPSIAPQAGTPPLRIFMLGGSTMWGTGARDSMTIPAIVASELSQEGIAAEVTNFGESGYVNTQELILLLLELQKGNIPDLVIFYDGANDVFSAYQQGVAGLPQNEFNRAREFNLTARGNRANLRSAALQHTILDLSTVRLLNGLIRWFGFIDEPDAMSSSAISKGDDAIALDVVAKYKRNVEMINALSKQYGFKVLFYWQPTVFHKQHLTAYENSWRQRARSLESFFLKTYKLVRQGMAARAADTGFRDLSLIFSNTREPIYVDLFHLAENGNDAVAKEMAKDILLMVPATAGAAAKQ
jgi:lysophospholipase L1-like esterase